MQANESPDGAAIRAAWGDTAVSSATGTNRLGPGLTEFHAEIERLQRRNLELERSNAELARFALMASHDLQEPLRVITTYSELLLEKFGPRGDDASMAAHNVADAATRMHELLVDLLGYCISGAPPQEAVAAVDLNQVIQEATENLKTSIDESQATVTWEGLPVVQARLNDFLRLFQNLLANAIKYRSERPPVIHISASQQDGQLCFAVSDNGIGIDAARQREVFEPFKRLHGREIPGTGLGLAICRRLVKRYEGRIWVQSRPGEGSTFLFTVPAATEKTILRA